MESTPMHGRPQPEPPAPVAGGMRWRGHRHIIADWCRRAGGFTVHDPDAPMPGRPYQAEPGLSGAPLIASTPPAEARVGGEYVYQARAYDCHTQGFTWYFEKSPPGMTVDRHTGKVAWTPTDGGYVEIALCARSLYGAVSRQTWTLCVRKPAAVRPPLISRRFQEALRRKIIPRKQVFRAFRCIGWRRTGTHHQATAPPERRLRTALPLRR